MTVAHIVDRAGVSRRTFYELFRDAEECLVATLNDALQRASEPVLAAWSSSGSGWRERARASVIALLYLFDEDPVLARLLVVESLGAGHRVLEQRARVLNRVTDALDEQARSEARHGRVRSRNYDARLSMEGALGGILGILHARIAQRPPGRLTELTGPLTGMLMLPYNGPAAARREAARAIPSQAVKLNGRSASPPLRADVFKDAGMRLTYRTMRVLCAIAEHPGSSNRKIARLAEISDQGQMSKLLARLERLGLVVNTSDGSARGEANAWTLTAAGRQLTSRFNAHAQPGACANGSESL